ncbi:MAG: hypothetical protein AAF583_02225 [Pseudomonadota bacterium]
MQKINNQVSGILEAVISVTGAALLVVQTIGGADGMAQMAAALVTLVAPVCGAIRETRGSGAVKQAEVIAGVVTDALESSSET